jgi:argininosuccinate lyase
MIKTLVLQNIVILLVDVLEKMLTAMTTMLVLMTIVITRKDANMTMSYVKITTLAQKIAAVPLPDANMIQ